MQSWYQCTTQRNLNITIVSWWLTLQYRNNGTTKIKFNRPLATKDEYISWIKLSRILTQLNQLYELYSFVPAFLKTTNVKTTEKHQTTLSFHNSLAFLHYRLHKEHILPTNDCKTKHYFKMITQCKDSKYQWKTMTNNLNVTIICSNDTAILPTSFESVA